MEQLVQNATKFIKEIFQNDFSGHDFFHSMRVYRTAINIAEAEHADMEVVALAALLHDVVEDTPVTLEDLANAGFSGRVLHAVCCLTHKYGETREAYISRIAEDPLAVRVKLADLAHNSDLSRMPAPSAKDYARAERYAKEAAFLMKANKQGGVSLEER